MKPPATDRAADASARQYSLELCPLPAGARIISRHAWFVDEHGVRTVFVGRTVVSQYAVHDKLGRNLGLTHLARCKYATQQEVADAFGLTRRTVSRLCQEVAREGVSGLVRKPRRDKTSGAVVKQVCARRAEGLRVRAIAERTGISARTVRTLLREQGYDPHDSRGGKHLAWEEGGQDNVGVPQTREAPQRREQAAGGAWEGAESGEPGRGREAGVVFGDGEQVPGAGALLAVAVEDGVLVATARAVYQGLRGGVYGLRAVVMGLLLMAWLGVKNAESLKGKDPWGVGRLLGLERVFEVKTLRRKLRELGQRRQAGLWHEAVSQRWVAAAREELGTLYVDGHTRASWGKHKLAKGWCARRRLCQPATTETWANDARGEPLLRVHHEAHPTVSQVLPTILQDVRGLIGPRPCTVAFDRGGWSGPTFRQLVGAGFDFVTYRPGDYAPVASELFEEFAVEQQGHPKKVYRLAETRLQVRGYGEARLIAVLRDGGHQTHIVTSREGLPALEVAQQLFGRWRQENYFKYMREHYKLDALVDYGTEAVADREIPHPQREALGKQLQRARAKLRALQAQLQETGAATAAGQQLGAQVTVQRQQVHDVEQARQALPRRALLSETERADEVKLAVERKLFSDVVKMAAYRAECELVRRVGASFARCEAEGHAFVRAALQQPGHLRVEGRTLHITLAPMSAPRFTRALAALCEAVNADRPTYPESRCRLHFAVADPTQNETPPRG